MKTPANPPITVAGRLRQKLVDFVAAPASPRPLAALRIGVAFVLLCQAIAISASLLDLFVLAASSSGP